MTRISRREATLGLAMTAGALAVGEAFAGATQTSTAYDLLIRGGEAIDPANGTRERRDIGVRDGRISAVAAEIPSAHARTTIDAVGRLVVPGLVDLIGHVATGGPRQRDGATRSIATTVVSAGDVSVRDVSPLRRLASGRVDARLLAFPSIAGAGRDGRPVPELYGIDAEALDIAADLLVRHADIVLGLDVRLSDNVVARHGLAPLARAIRACEEAGTGARVLCHLGSAGSEAISKRALGLLRPGDVLADGYARTPVFATRLAGPTGTDSAGRNLDSLREARRRGVVLAINDAGMLDDAFAARAIEEGVAPDIIASAAHIDAPGVHGLTHTMGRMLELGMTFAQVIAAATAHPARIVGRDPLHGTLQPGAPADISLLVQREVQDRKGRRRVRLEPAGTIVAGVPVRQHHAGSPGRNPA